MKILTINIHSHFNKMTEEQFQMALNHLSDLIIRDSLDFIALQECSQTCQENVVEGTYPGSFCPIKTDTVPVRKDNFALLLAKVLEEKGKKYYWSWTGAKIGYDMFDEGLAIFSLHPIADVEAFYFSKQADYHNWKSRKTIGACIQYGGKKNWFYSVHMGWWKDEEEPFISQMNSLHKKLMEKEENVFLLGDFNSQANIHGEGYDYVKELGWQDTYLLAREKDDGITCSPDSSLMCHSTLQICDKKSFLLPYKRRETKGETAKNTVQHHGSGHLSRKGGGRGRTCSFAS